MPTLLPGANASITQDPLTVIVDYTPVAGAEMDIAAFLLQAHGKVRGDVDMCFYGQTRVAGGAVQLSAAQAGRVTFDLHLARLDASIEKVVFSATFYENRARFSACTRLAVQLTGDITATIPTKDMQETALIVGECYRYKGAWKFRCVGQGFVGGLAPLATHFGVDIAAPPTPSVPAPVPTPPKPAPAPTAPLTPLQSTLNLSKITLDKSRASISLEKQNGRDFGEIKVNLNWHRGSAGSGGILSKLLGSATSIDLDVGCLFELQTEGKGVVQALGNAFGSFNSAPYIQLMADDRTGASVDGEWLRINGNQWAHIQRVLIYAFIYQGAPNWDTTDAVVTLYVPNQPPIEVRVREEGGQDNLCAIALLENVGGAVKVSREVHFFRDQERADKHYHWGLRWKAGSK